jgi:hypothetical protein
LVVFDIDGERFVLVKTLASDQLRAMNTEHDNVSNAVENAGGQRIRVLAANAVTEYEMICKTIEDCFGKTRKEVEDLSIFTLYRLYEEVYSYSLRDNNMK